jgi:hypothetical protein
LKTGGGVGQLAAAGCDQPVEGWPQVGCELHWDAMQNLSIQRIYWKRREFISSSCFALVNLPICSKLSND